MKSKIFSLIFTILFALIFLFAVNLLYDILYPVKFETQIEKYCNEFNVEKELVFAVINAESSFDFKAISSAGAKGLMQLLPTTAEFIAEKINYTQKIDLFNIDCNLNLGVAYLSYLQNIFKEFDIVVCAYNAGEGVVRDWLKSGGGKEFQIEYPETKRYLEKVKLGVKIYAKKLS